jgi:hypothetical protein
LAFHYDPQKLDSAFIDVPDDFDIFIEQEGNSNNLFYFGEVLAGRALLGESNNLSNENPYEKLIHEIFEVARWFTKVINEIFVFFISQYKDTIWEGTASEIKFDRLVSTLDVYLPWFTDLSQAYELNKEIT